MPLSSATATSSKQTSSGQSLIWDSPKGLTILIVVSAIMLLFMLGGREIWTLETRWANIVLNMLANGDYWHPILKAQPYYDKPLLSYWLIVAASWLTDGLNLFSLRLSSALSGMLAIYCTYLLGRQLWNKRVGIIAGLLLCSCYYFIFWGRVASADMLNVAGNMAALYWYYAKRDQQSIRCYAVFFMIISLTCLCKGLLGLVIPGLCLLPDLLQQQRWRRHLNLQLVLGIVPGLIIYLLPFLTSEATAAASYSDSGLYLVFKENVVRFFDPWDHQGPVYLYLLYLPIYTLPWAFFLPAALYRAKQQPKTSPDFQLLLALLALFIFFTLAGSRRSYYTLPMVPIAMLLITSWLEAAEGLVKPGKKLQLGIACTCALTLGVFAIFNPLYYSQGGPQAFNKQLEQALQKQKWRYVLLDVDNKIPIYLSKTTKQLYLGKPKADPKQMSVSELQAAWPQLSQIGRQGGKRDVFISQAQYEATLHQALPDYQIIHTPPILGRALRGKSNKHAAIAFVPPTAVTSR